MVIVKLHELVLPETSPAVHVTVLVPMGKVVPEGGTQVTTVKLSQLSVATTV
jgi:hypothetical protein